MKPPIFIFIVCILFSCDTASNLEKSESRVLVAPVMNSKEKTDEQPSQTDRKLIKTGYLSVSIRDAAIMKTAIEAICKDYDAYIASESQNNYPQRLQYQQVIRIPADHFDAFIRKVESLSVHVDSKNIQTTDVTEEFIDQTARIKTKKELEERYREILKQAKAVSDILSIEGQLNQVRSDIESMEGRLQYLRNQVAFSTLTLSFYQPIGTQFGFGSKIVASMRNGWEMMLIFIVGLLNIWPFMLMAMAIVYYVMRRVRLSKVRP